MQATSMAIVSNPSADAHEKIERAAHVLKASKQNFEVFTAIYRNSSRFKSIEQIRGSVSKPNKNTYKAAKRLYSEDIVERKIEGRVVFYGKKDFYATHRDKILRLVKNPARLKAYPTKRKIQVTITPKTSYSFQTKARVRQIYVDDIESFSRVRSIQGAKKANVLRLPERRINAGFCRILNQSEKKDWGGERNDIYTNKIRFNGSRKSAAFALKGKAIKTELMPGKMGKNGDQIQRLFDATADIYVVAHNRGINERVVDLMQVHAIGKSISHNKRIYFCVIDGDDLGRLVAAYPEYFLTN
jgi:hypothetical protein